MILSARVAALFSVMPAPSGNVVIGTRIMPSGPEGVGTFLPLSTCI